MIPIHEVHQEEAKYHGITTLPAKTIEEYQQQGGPLNGRGERVESFLGGPKYTLDRAPQGANGGLLQGPASGSNMNNSMKEIDSTPRSAPMPGMAATGGSSKMQQANRNEGLAMDKGLGGGKHNIEHRERVPVNGTGRSMLDVDGKPPGQNHHEATRAANRAMGSTRNAENNSDRVPGSWPAGQNQNVQGMTSNARREQDGIPNMSQRHDDNMVSGLEQDSPQTASESGLGNQKRGRRFSLIDKLKSHAGAVGA